MLWWLLSVALAGKDPCEGERRTMIVFPTEVSKEASDSDTEAAKLLAKILDGGMSIDYPLPRFETRLVGVAPKIDDGAIEGASERAVRQLIGCADLAVVPRLAALTHTTSGSSHQIALDLEVDVYERGSAGLTKVDTFRASAPSLVDSVEDMMSAARRSTIDQLKSALPVSERRLQKASSALDLAITSLPKEQREAAEKATTQGALAATRVASVARKPQIVPSVGDAAVKRTANGLSWRNIENDCYIKPPKEEDRDASERNLQCAALNRARQAIREVTLDTRKRYKLVTGAMVDSKLLLAPLGASEGVAVGDGFRLLSDGQRVGYARVRRVGSGGSAGWMEPSSLQRVYGGKLPSEITVEEDPRLGIEIGLSGGLAPAGRSRTRLPPDPLTGDARLLEAGRSAPAGALRFDVQLGRTAGWYEWYQTNRVSIVSAGELSEKIALFGLERRLLLAQRVYVLAGASLGFASLSLPSGATRLDSEGERVELDASGGTPLGSAETGLVAMLLPSLTLRLAAGGQIGRAIDELSWKDGDREGEITLRAPIRTSGLSFTLSGAIVF